MSPYESATIAWNTYLKNTYVNNKGETKPTYASKWRTSNPNLATAIQQYKDGKGPRPTSKDGFGPMIISVVDILVTTAPPTPPDPVPQIVAPRTFNKEGSSDARYCTTGLPFNDSRGMRYDVYTHYDSNGLDNDGGRDPNYISKKENGEPLRGAKSMDHYGPCDLYDGLTEWPPDSYHR